MLHRLWRRLLRITRTAEADALTPAATRAAFVEDLLTGLPTRQVALERLLHARRENAQGFLAAADLDHFKLLNDNFGIAAGDEVLRVVAERLQQALPPGGWVARMGGEEFLIFLPGLSQAEAVAWLNAANTRLHAPMELISAKVSASFGVTGFAGQSPDKLINACDLAVYAAKARGRNQVVVFDDDTRAVATRRRELAATVAELQQRNRALLDEVNTDALTGLRNRRAWQAALDEPLGHSGAVAVVDVDHFGAFNKHHGLSRGDEALRAVAQALQSALRDEDRVFRIGGEEFAVLLADVAGPAAALAAAQRLRMAVERLAIAHADSPTAPVLTVTIGVACMGPLQPLADALKLADRLTMDAKLARQRNQVHGPAVHDDGLAA